MKHRHHTLQYFARNLGIIVGIVLIWRGVWVVLDQIDLWLFGANHLSTAILGIIAGFVLLYLPDRDLKEISRL
jgi:hypothetical protein